MNRSRIIFFLVSSCVVFPLLAGSLLRAADRNTPSAEDDSFHKYLSVFMDVLTLSRQAHVDKPSMDVLMEGALDGTTDALDPFSIYIPAKAVDGYLESTAAGKRQSGLVLLKERGIAYVVAVEQGSPADQAGIRSGDIVTKINGSSTRSTPLWGIQEILAGKPGTKVSLDMLRIGEPVQASFELKPFNPPPASLSEVDGAPVLRIQSFEPETPAQVRAILQKQSWKEGLVLDLRGVSSGEAESAYGTAELFANGDLGALQRRQEILKTFAGKQQPLWKGGKLVVLVDRGTLGAGEVFATVLRQKSKAELVGERTFGHAGRMGSAQLSSGGRLMFTDAFYTGPDRKLLNESLKPDVLVSERSRTYLEKDVPLTELILRRGVRHLQGKEEPAQKAA